MRNEIIIPMLLVMAFFKITHPKVYISVNKVSAKVSENIDSDVSNFPT